MLIHPSDEITTMRRLGTILIFTNSALANGCYNLV